MIGETSWQEVALKLTMKMRCATEWKKSWRSMHLAINQSWLRSALCHAHVLALFCTDAHEFMR